MNLRQHGCTYITYEPFAKKSQAQSLILHKSSFYQEFERTTSVTVKNKEVSYAKSFELKCMFFIKSLNYRRKSSAAKMDPWRTPVLMPAHEEYLTCKILFVFYCLENQLKELTTS